MIPRLYESTDQTFTSFGICPMSDAISCIVEEKRNGSYELEMDYPVDSPYYAELETQRIILAQPFQAGTAQPFRIYEISKPIDKVVTVYAQHISYDLSGIPVIPFTATGITATLQGLTNNSLIANPFTFTSDISNQTSVYSQSEPSALRTRLGGIRGSVLDTFGGEYEWNGYSVILHANRGSDKGITIRYGKNLTDLKQTEDISAVYTGVIAYWYDEDTETLIQSDVYYIDNHANYPQERIYVLDQSMEYEDSPDAESLYSDAQNYALNNNIGVPKVTLTVSFVDEQTDQSNAMTYIQLCDTVHVYFEDLGVSASAKVIETQWDVLAERYKKIKIGDARSTFIDAVVEATSEEKEKETISAISGMVNHLTEQITGGLGGSIITIRDSDGKPMEFVVCDTDSINTAVGVWRWNKNGLAYSGNGYNGTYTLGMTNDGQIVADLITTGTLDAGVIKAGVLEDATGNNYWNLETGEITLGNLADKYESRLQINNDGLSIGVINSGDFVGYHMQMLADGFYVADGNTQTLIAREDTVTASNFVAKNFMIIDTGSYQSRFQQFSSDEDSNQIGCFWID